MGSCNAVMVFYIEGYIIFCFVFVACSCLDISCRLSIPLNVGTFTDIKDLFYFFFTLMCKCIVIKESITKVLFRTHLFTSFLEFSWRKVFIIVMMMMMITIIIMMMTTMIHSQRRQTISG